MTEEFKNSFIDGLLDSIKKDNGNWVRNSRKNGLLIEMRHIVSEINVIHHKKMTYNHRNGSRYYQSRYKIYRKGKLIMEISEDVYNLLMHTYNNLYLDSKSTQALKQRYVREPHKRYD